MKKVRTRFNNKSRIKKGDFVIITAGDDKGKIGKIACIEKGSCATKVVVEGCAMVTKHLRPAAGHQGRIIAKERSINISNVAFYDEKYSCRTKIGYRFVDGVKHRFAKSFNELIISSNK